MTSESSIDAKTPNAAGVKRARQTAGQRIATRDELRDVIRATFKREPGAELDAFLGPLKNWCATAQPRDAVEEDLIRSIVFGIGQVERLRRFRDLRRSMHLKEATEREESEVLKLGRRLLPLPHGLACVSDIADITDQRKRNLGTAEKDELSSPAWLVNRLESSPAGCEWLCERFGEVRDDLGFAVDCWLPAGTYTIILLMGRQAMDALDIPEVALVVLAGHTLDRERRNLLMQLRSELSREDVHRLREWVSAHARSTLERLDVEEGRQTLIGVVDRARARLRAKAEEHRSRETGDEARNAALLAFDSSEKGKALKRNELAQIRMLRRGLNVLREHRSWAEDQAYKGEGELR